MNLKPLAFLLTLVSLMVQPAAVAQVVLGPDIVQPELPAGTDPFSLTLDEIKKYSAAVNFEVVGHSYFKTDDRADWAKAKGRAGPETGSGFNTVRVSNGIAFLAGYNMPDTLPGILVADVSDPKNIRRLSFIPCRPQTRCPYLRVDEQRKLLIFGNDSNFPKGMRGPNAKRYDAQAGWSFWDISRPSKPKEVAFLPVPVGGLTHGMDLDDNGYLFGCRSSEPGRPIEGLTIIDYRDITRVRQVGSWHVVGSLSGETPEPLNRLGPDGRQQVLKCHEIVYNNDRLYVAWRDAGMKILDVSDRTKPRLLATFDYVPPFHGGVNGAAHTVVPVLPTPTMQPDLVVMTDEIFECPAGTGRILDVSDMKSPEVVRGEREPNVISLSSFRIPSVVDNFSHETGKFTCPGIQTEDIAVTGNTTHLPVFDLRSPSLLYVSWYAHGLRVLDISNPYAPNFIGFYASPRFELPPETQGRRAREIFQDPKTNLLYLTDGQGGGLTILRYTGPLPKDPPIPGAR